MKPEKAQVKIKEKTSPPQHQPQQGSLAEIFPEAVEKHAKHSIVPILCNFQSTVIQGRGGSPHRNNGQGAYKPQQI